MQVSKLNDALPASDPVDTEVDYVKATVKAKEDSSTPATVVVEPVNDAATPELTGPATPAPMPSDKAVPGDKDSLDLVQAEPELVRNQPLPFLHTRMDTFVRAPSLILKMPFSFHLQPWCKPERADRATGRGEGTAWFGGGERCTWRGARS